MDYTILYTIIIIAVVMGLTYFVVYLKKNNIVTKEDLQVVEQIFNLTNSIISELDLKNEKKILQISQIVASSLDYAIKISGSESDIDIIDEAIKQTYSLCDDLQIELTESRKIIINQLIDLGLKNRYAQSSAGTYIRKITK